jgi:hypothetical protein
MQDFMQDFMRDEPDLARGDGSDAVIEHLQVQALQIGNIAR